ncbi:hypothetical protein SASPL_154191 [Salvia splendens]|uniref:CP-type G domain-containing protein n=1 Tax=Salvia splendens TaxID=180675 RepID=A0A8X8VZQ0_SALSN|nr:guanine nucleotide-binding protein-like NSN1 [Salvia splendens]KAG6385358.1 hypothetical protein SASPL_154191 [Salvia splendens]
MAKCNKKSKSKRVPLRKKHKIIRKLKEHQKKKSKEAKKLEVNTKQKLDKDPANDLPLNEDELKALSDRRQRAREELAANKKEKAQKRKLGVLDDEEIEGDENPSGVTRKVDNSEKAFYKELVKVIEASDVILEVLDARDPLGTRSVDMEKMVLSAGPDKHLVLLLNKIDLVPREAAEKWLKYLREELPAVAFKCSTQEQKSNLGWKSAPKAGKTKNLLQTSDCLGAETLIKLLKNYSRSHDIKKSITVGIIGLPNVGKSSIINSLKRSHVVNVGATPGLTRSMQEVHLDKNVKLLDCPGVVMLKSAANDATVALRNCKRIEKLDDPVGPVKEILKLCPEQVLVTLYKVPSIDSVDDFLQKVAMARGKFKKGGVVDIDVTARIVLHDWNEGKIPYYTMPPKRNADEPSEARIVSELGKEFNIDEVYGSESTIIGSLKSVNEFIPVEVAPTCPLNFDMVWPEDNQGNDGGDQPMESGDQPVESGEDATNVSEEEKSKSATTRQNEKLYAEEGMLNTKMRKADKKRRKKENQTSTMEHDEYEFKAGYVKESSAMETGDEEESHFKKNRFELPCGLDLDDE